MGKYEELKMKEIVKIEDSDSGDELTVTFTDSKTMKIKVVDNKLVSEFV
jgi:hypothetical protein